ncbi:MAG TPA: histidine kinase dimerization/phospho-acceptor domain-containing protein, partial [Acidimicrobiales bacterium]|nr:histidine kinase dimerization/phospho-acceptor domain-containing protein [Acidimicrobiales bacterium]
MSDAAHESRSRAWVDLSIRTKGLIVIAVPVLLLFALLGALIWFTQTDREAQAAGTQARSVLSTASMLEGALFDAHTDATGFIVTGDSSFLAAYQKAVAPVPGQLAQLRAGAGRSPAELAAIGAVDRDATALLAALSQGTHSDAPPQNAATLLHQTEAASGRLRAGVTALDAVENRSLAADHGAVSAANRNLVVAGIVAVFLGLAGGFLAMWLFTDGVATRLRRLERATTADADVFSLADLPEGEDEIGRLASRFTRTTSELAAWAEERDRARDQLEEILTASPIVSLRYQDASRRFTYASPNVERLLGLSAGEVLADGGLLAGRIHPEDLERLAKAMEDGVVRRGDRVSLSLRFRRDPESPAWGEADTVITPDIGADGTIVGAVVYLVDSSERHTAQRAADERRFMLESIFRASPDTIAVRDEVGRVVLASTSLAEVMGTDDTPEIGPPAADSRRLIDELAARSAAASQDMGPVVTSARGSDGAVHLFETRARPVLDEFGTVTGTVTISRDITERIRLEESLRDATASAERASEAKSEFLSRMSHELRTPLNAILGFAQLLELDELPGDQASSVDQIQRAGRHLLSLINEVLDISRIEAGQLSIDTAPVDVADVLVEVTTLLTPVAEAAGAELSVDTAGAASLWVHADRQRLLQVLLNLGSNALKYGGLHGAVTFATLVERSGEGEPVVRFEVSDRGPGIPRDKQDEIWVPFARIGAERTRVEGTGVGLALSKHLVELMGGSIGVRSRLG